MYVTSQIKVNPVEMQNVLESSAVRSDEHKTRKGSYVFREGDDVDYLYQVKTGALRLTRLLEDGRRQIIAFGLPGDIVGFPSNGAYHADCDVLTEGSVSTLPKSMLESDAVCPQAQSALLNIALREINAMQDHFLVLGRKSADEKVTSFLLALTERIGKTSGTKTYVDLPMSRADIADFLGLTTETVSRIFTALRKAEFIALESLTRVVILNQSALERLSEESD